MNANVFNFQKMVIKRSQKQDFQRRAGYQVTHFKIVKPLILASE